MRRSLREKRRLRFEAFAIGDDNNGVDPEELVEVLSESLQTLEPREVQIISDYFGLEGASCKTLEEIGGEMGVTRERVRQLRNRALQKMRSHLETLEFEVSINNATGMRRFFPFALFACVTVCCHAWAVYAKEESAVSYGEALRHTALVIGDGFEAGSPDEVQAIARFTEFLREWDPETIADSVRSVYASDAYFNDTIKRNQHE